MISVGEGGLCNAHGPYKKGMQCPEWPSCVHATPNPFYAAAGNWFVNYPCVLEEIKNEVVDAAEDFIFNVSRDRTRLTNALLKLTHVEAKNEMFRKLAGWDDVS